MSPPSNDLLADATVVPSIPFTDAVDTTGATVDADDAQANSLCQASQLGNSVWYSYTTTDTITLVVDAVGSDYDTGVVIATGSPGSLQPVSCATGGGRIYAGIGSGITVSIVLFDASGSGGGNLAVSIYEAVPPPNDSIGGATTIASLPFTDTVDTLRATTDADDEQVNGSCGLSQTKNSVWYSFTAGPADTSVVFDTTSSTYRANIIVATGSPGTLTTLVCGSDHLVAPTTPGTTYYVLISNDFFSGGRLQLDVVPTPHPAEIAVHLRAAGTVDHLGIAHLAGKYRCSNAFSANIFGTARRGGRMGFLFLDPGRIACDGDPHRFWVAVHDDGGRSFRPGSIDVSASGMACNEGGCVFTFEERSVRLIRV